MTLLRRASILLAALVVLLGLAVGTASAHTKLVSTDPADGAVLSAPPATVSFTFDEDLLEGTDTISINDANGTVISTQSVTTQGAVVTAQWPAEASNGTFQVAYRVVADDGHPVTGAITITIGGDGAAAASASPAASPDASPASTTDEAQPRRGIAGSLVVIVGIVVVGLIVFAAVMMIRRRSL